MAKALPVLTCGAMAEAQGLSVHVYTSPHLVRFNERIRLAGDLVEDEDLVSWLNRVHAALDGREITRFEATTATALLAFSEIPADLLILEVGLGGRYERNQCHPGAGAQRDHAGRF